MSDRRVVITGLGPVAPIGVGVTDFWNALLEGKSATRRIQAFDPGGFASQVGGEIDGLKVADFVPKKYRKAGRIMARDIELAVIAAHYAVSDASIHTKCLIDRSDADGSKAINSERFGANIGAGQICADLSELSEALASADDGGEFSLKVWGAEGMQNLTPLWLLKFLPNMLACHVTIVHDAQGPSNTITCCEASSHLAIGEAFRTISRGVADVCICGGAESKLNPMALMRQQLGERLSTANDTPDRACRPFGNNRDGTVVSEGGGLVILEELNHARERGARIYAELIGFGASNDAFEAAQPPRPSPDGRGLLVSMNKALADADITIDDINLIGAFAAGLPERDAVEARAYSTLFGDKLVETPVMPIKGGIGNNGAGSGTLDFIATVLALHHNTLPPAVNCDPLDDEIGLKINNAGPTDAPVDYAISNTYALSGGQHASLVIHRFRD